MTTFRVEYYDEKTKSMVVAVVQAEDSNEVKTKYKHKALSVCEKKAYDVMLAKYGDIMRP